MKNKRWFLAVFLFVFCVSRTVFPAIMLAPPRGPEMFEAGLGGTADKLLNYDDPMVRLTALQCLGYHELNKENMPEILKAHFAALGDKNSDIVSYADKWLDEFSICFPKERDPVSLIKVYLNIERCFPPGKEKARKKIGQITPEATADAFEVVKYALGLVTDKDEYASMAGYNIVSNVNLALIEAEAGEGIIDLCAEKMRTTGYKNAKLACIRCLNSADCKYEEIADLFCDELSKANDPVIASALIDGIKDIAEKGYVCNKMIQVLKGSLAEIDVCCTGKSIEALGEIAGNDEKYARDVANAVISKYDDMDMDNKEESVRLLSVLKTKGFGAKVKTALAGIYLDFIKDERNTRVGDAVSGLGAIGLNIKGFSPGEIILPIINKAPRCDGASGIKIKEYFSKLRIDAIKGDNQDEVVRLFGRIIECSAWDELQCECAVRSFSSTKIKKLRLAKEAFVYIAEGLRREDSCVLVTAMEVLCNADYDGFEVPVEVINGIVLHLNKKSDINKYTLMQMDNLNLKKAVISGKVVRTLRYTNIDYDGLLLSGILKIIGKIRMLEFEKHGELGALFNYVIFPILRCPDDVVCKAESYDAIMSYDIYELSRPEVLADACLSDVGCSFAGNESVDIIATSLYGKVVKSYGLKRFTLHYLTDKLKDGAHNKKLLWNSIKKVLDGINIEGESDYVALMQYFEVLDRTSDEELGRLKLLMSIFLKLKGIRA